MRIFYYILLKSTMSLGNLGNIFDSFGGTISGLKEFTSLLNSLGGSPLTNANNIALALEKLNSLNETENGLSALQSLIPVMKTFDDSASSISNIGNALKGLNDDAKSAVLGIFDLTESQAENILVNLGFQGEALKSGVAAVASGAGAKTGAVGFEAFTASVKSATKGLLTFLVTNPVGWAILAVGALGAVSAGIKAHNEKVQESIDKAKEATAAWSESSNTLNDYADKIINLREVLESETLTEKESYQAKSDLLDIQNSLTESYKGQVEGIDLVNGSLKEQLGLIEKVARNQANELLNDKDNQVAYKKAKKKLLNPTTKDIGILPTEFSGKDIRKFNEILNKYKEYISTYESENMGIQLTFSGTSEEANKVLNEFLTDVRNVKDDLEDEHMLDGVYKRASEQLKNYNDTLKDYQDIYEKMETAKLVADNVLYGLDGEESKTAYKWLNEYTTAVEKYNKALASGDDADISEAAKEFGVVDSSIQTLINGSMEQYKEQFTDIEDQINRTAIAQNDFVNALNGLVLNGNSKLKEYADALKEYKFSDFEFKYAFSTDGSQRGEEVINKVVDIAEEAGVINDKSIGQVEKLIEILVKEGVLISEATASVAALETKLVDFTSYQELANEALEASMSATGLTAEQVNNLTKSYENLDSFDPSKLFEETANGVHLNQKEFKKLNKELESNQIKAYTDKIKELRKEIYIQRENGADTFGLEAELEKTIRLKSEYEGLTSAYNKWLKAKEAPKERDSYEGIGSGYEEMKETLELGWYGDESLNAYLDTMLSVSQRTGDAKKDFEQLNKTIEGTSHSIMDYWQYDDGKLSQDGLFDFLDDVNKKFGDSYASIDEEGKYAFDFTGDRVKEVADAFGMSTELVEMFVRAMIDAGMAIDMNDLSPTEEINKALDNLQKYQDSGELSNTLNLEFDIESEPLEKVKSYIDDLKEERIKINAEEDPELAKELDDLIAKCEEEYTFRLEAEEGVVTNLDIALSDINRIKEIASTPSPVTFETQVKNTNELNELALQISQLPESVQIKAGIEPENVGNAQSIINQFNVPSYLTLPAKITPKALTQEEMPEIPELITTTNVILGDYPTELPKPMTGTVNVELGKYPKYLPAINQTVYQNVVKRSNAQGSAHSKGTVLSGYSNGRNWSLPKSEEALVNEIGTESIVRDGKWFLIPGKAHVEQLKKGDIIFSATQTQEILKTGKVTSGGGHGRVALADGTAYNTLSLKAYNTGSNGSRRDDTPSGSKKSSSSSKKSSSSKSSSSDDSDIFDWIEIAIDRIERAINRLKNTAESTYKALKTKLGATADEITKVNQEISLQQKAYDRYMQEASSVGLSSSLKEKVRNGDIDISEYSSKTQDLINQYKEFYEKALNCSDSVQQLHEDLASLYEDNFNNTKDDFDNQLELAEHLINQYENGVDLLEARGYLESTKYYSAMQEATKGNIAILKNELTALEQSFSDAINSGEIEKYSEAWYSMSTEINSVKEEIAEANIELAEYAQTMKEIEWGYFDYTQERISQLTQEADFLIDLLSNSDLHTDNGQFTDKGMTTMGLHAQNYNVYMSQADMYASELAEINKEIANDKYNTKLIERREELLGLQQDSILAAEEEKQAIASLVEDGINLELDSLQELIDTYTESLDSAKDLYEFQKKIENQTSNIASIEKQLSAYSGLEDEETRATIQKLKVELDSAKQELEETQYDQYINDQKKLLDELYNSYSELLNTRLDDTNALIEDMITSVNSNSDVVNDTLATTANDVGYTITADMQNIWNGSIDTLDGTISKYGDGFTEKLTSVQSVLNSIQTNTAIVAGISEEEAQETIDNTNAETIPTVPEAPTVSIPTATQPDTPSNSENAIVVGGKINAKGAKIYDYAGDKSGEKQYYGNDPIYNVLEEKNGYLKVRYHKLSKGVTGWFKKSEVKAYKTGGLVDYTGLAQVDGTPKKPELMLNAKDTENFLQLRDVLREMGSREITIGDSLLGNKAHVIDALPHLVGISDMSSKLSALKNNGVSQNQNVTFGDINIDIDHVENYDDLVTKLQHDNKFENMILAMTTDRISGKSSLEKYKYRW